MLKNLLCLLLILGSVKGYAQESVTFKTSILPNKKYSHTFKTTSNSFVQILSDEETIERLKESGQDPNMTIETSSTRKAEMLTAGRDKNGVVPVSIDLGEISIVTTVNGTATSAKDPITGTRLLGRYGADGKFELDSIISEKEGLTDKKAITAVIESIQNSVAFPEKPMKVGDRFHTAIPFDFPMAGMDPVAMNVDSEYLLTAIRGGLAYFDIVQSITFDMTTKEFEMTASGTGTGKLEYSIAENYTTKYSTELPMDMDLTVNDKMNMKFKMTMISEQVATIE